jgi:xylulokinase
MTYLLGIDVGTSGCKAVLVDDHGAVVATATRDYPLHTPRAAWAEQDPADWWRATCETIGAALDTASVHPDDVASVGLTGQMHGLVLLDTAGAVLRPAILWNDQRSAAQCAEIERSVGPEHVLEHTGNRVLPGFTAPKLLWVRAHEPEVYARVAHVLLPKDYVRYRLTGALGTDVSDASGTSVFDVRNRRWSGEMLDALDLPPTWWPDAAESPEVTAYVHADGAHATRLLEGTPVVAGAGDQAAGAVGAGIVEEGRLSVTLGTSGVVFATTDAYRADAEGRLHAFCHAVPDRWHLMGVTLAAAGSLRWWRDAVAPDATFATLLDEAADTPLGAERLLFLPYLSGERTPHADPDARGVFFGLSLRHGQAHLTRAVLEGVAFSLRDLLTLMSDLGVAGREARVAGGGAQSPLWRQILADVLDLSLTPSTTEGAAYGAALLAGVGAGVWPDVPAAGRTARTDGGVTHPGDAAVYEPLYAQYRALYPALAPHFAALAATDLA